MAQSHVTDRNYGQLTFKHNADELVSVKRMPKKDEAPTEKNIVVLKSSDVTKRDELVFLPNTIEMAQLKKPEKGQFKTKVQISSKMTEVDIKNILVEKFPFLEHQRFWCAAAVDNRTRLDFHGERRIWNGRAIKQKIKGNSALYIFTDENPEVSELSTLKRSHDQISFLENDKSEQALKREAAAENIPELLTSHTAFPGSEKKAKLFAVGASYPNMGLPTGAGGTAAANGTVLEKGDYSHQTHEGTIMVPGGVVVAQPGLTQKITSQTSNLNISKADFMQLQKPVNAEKCTGKRYQSAPIAEEDRELSQHVLPVRMSSQSDRCFSDELCKDTPGQQHDVFRSLDQSKQSSDVNTQVLQQFVTVIHNSNQTDRQDWFPGTSAHSLHQTEEQSDIISEFMVSTEPTPDLLYQILESPMESNDKEQGVFGCTYANSFHTNGAPDLQMTASTFEQDRSTALSLNMGNLAIADQTQEFDDDSEKDHTDDSTVTLVPGVHEEVSGQCSSSSDFLTTSGISDDNDLDSSEQELLQNLPNLQNEVKAVPSRVPLQGEDYCRFDFKLGLPLRCLSGSATFENLGSVNLWSHNNSMNGYRIPPKKEPGWVTVSLETETGVYLGQTKIYYFNKDDECVEMVLQDRKLLQRVLSKLADRIGGQTDAGGSETQHSINLGIASEEDNHQVESDSAIDTGYCGDAEPSSSGSSPQQSRPDSENDNSEISFEECENHLKADSLDKKTDKKGAASSLDSSDLTDIHSEEKKVETHCCLNEGCNAQKENVTKRPTSLFIFRRPVTSFSRWLSMSFINEGVFPSEQLNGKGRRNTSNHALQEKCFFQMIEHFYRDVHDLQRIKSVHHPGISFLLRIATERIPRHLSTMYERWGIQLQLNRDSGENIVHRLSVLFHKMNLGLADGRLAISWTQPAVFGESNFVQDLEPSYVDDGSSTSNDEVSPIKGKAVDYPTKHRSTTSDVWVMTGMYRPTRKILFVYTADRSDCLPPDSWLEDEDCELSTDCWKWQRCGNNLFKFIERPKGMPEHPGLEQSQLDPSTLDPHVTYMLPHINADKLTRYESCQCPGWLYPMLYHCWTHDPVKKPPFIATFGNVLARDPISSWIMTSGLSNSEEGKPSELDICLPHDICCVTNAKIRYCFVHELDENQTADKVCNERRQPNDEGELLNELYSGDRMPCFQKFSSDHQFKNVNLKEGRYCICNDLKICVEKISKKSTSLTVYFSKRDYRNVCCEKVLADVLAISTSLAALTLDVDNDGSMSNSWSRHLGDGLAKNTSLTTLALTINNSGDESGGWARYLANGLGKNTSLTTLTLTINNSGDKSGDWAYFLAVGLGKNTSLTTLTLTINNSGDKSGDWAYFLAVGLGKNASLTTLTLTLNNCDDTFESWRVRLAKKFKRSKSLTSFTLIVNNREHLTESWGVVDLAEGFAKNKSLITPIPITTNSDEGKRPELDIRHPHDTCHVKSAKQRPENSTALFSENQIAEKVCNEKLQPNDDKNVTDNFIINSGDTRGSGLAEGLTEGLAEVTSVTITNEL